MDEENNVNPDTPNETFEENVETPFTDTQEDTIETPEIDVEQLQATNKKLYERAKKAEADLKTLRGTKPAEASVSPQLNVEETVLLANGMPEELLGELKVVAQVRKLTLIKAQTDPIFIAVKEKFEKDKKRESASLGASRGSSSARAVKTANTPGLTREEHMAIAKSQ